MSVIVNSLKYMQDQVKQLALKKVNNTFGSAHMEYLAGRQSTTPFVLLLLFVLS